MLPKTVHTEWLIKNDMDENCFLWGASLILENNDGVGSVLSGLTDIQSRSRKGKWEGYFQVEKMVYFTL